MSSKSSFYNSTGVTNTQSNAIDASVNNAEASAVASATSATSSEDSSISSGNSATASANSAIASASSATSSETARNESVSAKDLAQTAATESSASAVASENSKLAANVSAVQANTSASTANSAVTNANLQRGLAETAKTAAETAQTAAETALDEFTDIYLGSKTSAPTTDNDGDALVAGAIYWHSTNGQLYIWNGSAWNNAAFDASGTVTAFNSRTGSVTLSSADVTGADGLLTTGGSMSGDLLVGGTNALAAVSITGTANDQGIVCGDDGMLQVSTFKSYGGGSASYFNRVNNDGDLIRFNRTGFTKGRIGVDTGELYIDSNALILRHDGDDVLKTTATGINVTGTVTSDGLTVDGQTQLTRPSTEGLVLTLDSAGNAARSLEVSSFTNSVAGAGWDWNASGSTGAVQLSTAGTSRLFVQNNGDISFYEDTGTTAKFFWDSSAERLGLGNTAPSSILHLTDTHPSILFETSGGGATDQAYIQKYSNDLYIYNKESAGKIFLGTNNQTKATIDSSGQVGIGTDSPTNVKLQINGSLSGTSGTGHLAFGETSAPFWNWRLNTSTADLILDRSYGGWQSTPVMAFDRSSGNVGIGTGSPDANLHVYQSGSSNSIVKIERATGNTASLTAGASTGLTINSDNSNGGDAITRFTQNSSEAMRINSSGNVGIGTSSPDEALEVNGDLKISGSGFGIVQFGETSDQTKIVGRDNSHASQSNTMDFFTNSEHRMRIDSSGQVGIGTSSPDQLLHLEGANATGNTNPITLRFTDTDTASAVNQIVGRIEFEGRDAGASGVGSFIQGVAEDVSGKQYLSFGTGTSGSATERMRIDSSGNVLVGTTDNTPYNNSGAGNGGSALHADGLFSAARDGNAVGIFNRLSSDGDIVEFRKDGLTKVGNIGTIGSDLTIGTGDVALRFQDGSDNLIPHNVSTNSTRDAGINIGTSGARFKDLYLSGGVYLGGTGSANKLDDYEIGAASSLAISGSYGNCPSSGWTLVDSDYVKVGKSVTVRARFINTSTNNVQVDDRAVVSGLPFTSDSFGTVASAGTCFIYGQISGGINAMGVTALSTNGTDAFFYITHEDGAVQYNVPLTVIFSYKTT